MLFTFNVIPLFTYVLECLQRHKRIEGNNVSELVLKFNHFNDLLGILNQCIFDSVACLREFELTVSNVH